MCMKNPAQLRSQVRIYFKCNLETPGIKNTSSENTIQAYFLLHEVRKIYYGVVSAWLFLHNMQAYSSAFTGHCCLALHVLYHVSRDYLNAAFDQVRFLVSSKMSKTRLFVSLPLFYVIWLCFNPVILTLFNIQGDTIGRERF